MSSTTKHVIACGIAGALALAASAASAAPVPTNTAAVKSAVAGQTTQVRFWHHGFFGPGPFIGGLALGLAGAAIAAPYYWDGPAYAYAPGPVYYDYGYAYAPGPYVGWGGPVWHHRHYYRRW